MFQDRGEADAQVGERRLELFLRGPGKAQSPAGGHGSGAGRQGGRDAELLRLKPLADAGRYRSGQPQHRQQHQKHLELESAPGAEERGPLRCRCFHGPGAELAADTAKCDSLPRRSDFDALLLRLVGAAVLRNSSR